MESKDKISSGIYEPKAKNEWKLKNTFPWDICQQLFFEGGK